MSQDHQFPNPLIINGRQFGDDRGRFFARPLDSIWIQQNISVSQKGVFRGMHFQIGNYAQSKLVRVLSGSVLDFVVDLRNSNGNQNYLKIYQFYLSDNKSESEYNSLFVPKGFAHGFLALENNTVFEYLVDSHYQPEFNRSIHYSSFPLISQTSKEYDIHIGAPLISEKDDTAPSLEDWLKLQEPTLPLI